MISRVQTVPEPGLSVPLPSSNFNYKGVLQAFHSSCLCCMQLHAYCILKQTRRLLLRPTSCNSRTASFQTFRSLSAMYSSKDQPSQNSKVLVFGSGNFGSCLASHLGDSQHDVYMWGRDKSIVEHFNTHHRNLMYLRDHQFPSNITAIGPELPDKGFMDKMDVLLFAIPTQFLR